MISTILISVLIPLSLLLYNYFQTKKSTDHKNKIVEAQALLMNVQQTGVYLNKLAQVKLQMQVYPKLHQKFETEVVEVMDRSHLKKLRAGDLLLVKYNPLNTKEVMVVKP